MSELSGLMAAAHFSATTTGANRVSMVEVCAGRLYTGPMSCKYQLALRSCASGLLLDAPVEEATRKPPAKPAPTTKSRSTKVMVKPLTTHGNKYPTTIHLINSLVVKLSKLTNAQSVVYRSVSNGVDGLPPDLRDISTTTHGVRGMVDAAFTNATSELGDAMNHAISGFMLRKQPCDDDEMKEV